MPAQLGRSGKIKHVIYVQFDNTHFARDNQNVASDLEQMPHLLNFIRGNGTLMTNDHTVLISHTATGILYVADGRLPGPHGPARVEQLPVLHAVRRNADRCRVRLLDGTVVRSGRAAVPPAGQTDLTPEMVNENGKDHSGAVGSVSPGPAVTSARSRRPTRSSRTPASTSRRCSAPARPRPIQAAGDSPGVAGTQAFADYVGIGVHCAQGSRHLRSQPTTSATRPASRTSPAATPATRVCSAPSTSIR